MEKRHIKKEKVWDEAMQTFLEMHHKEMKLQAIALELGVSVTTVWRHIQKLPGYYKKRNVDTDLDAPEPARTWVRPPAVYSNKSYQL